MELYKDMKKELCNVNKWFKCSYLKLNPRQVFIPLKHSALEEISDDYDVFINDCKIIAMSY